MLLRFGFLGGGKDGRGGRFCMMCRVLDLAAGLGGGVGLVVERGV